MALLLEGEGWWIRWGLWVTAFEERLLVLGPGI